jgi:hypothetical protein
MYRKLIEDFIRTRELVDFRRAQIKADDLRGFALRASDSLILLQIVSDDVYLNGFSIIRSEDITFLRWGNQTLRSWQDALPDNKSSASPSVDVESWESAIASILQIERLITFNLEAADHDACYIGRNVTLEQGVVVADEIHTDGKCDGQFTLRLEDVTRVDFGQAYERGLERILQRSEP